jgi:hypothetical protein
MVRAGARRQASKPLALERVEEVPRRAASASRRPSAAAHPLLQPTPTVRRGEAEPAQKIALCVRAWHGAAPLITYNLLRTDRDVRRLLEGVRISRRIGRDAAFAKVVEMEMTPGPSVTDDDSLKQTILEQVDVY